MSKYIVRNPDILGGALVLAGTRIPMSRILFLMLKENYTTENVLEEYPQLSKSLLDGALDEYIENNAKKTL